MDTTIKQLYDQIKNNFQKAGIDSPAFESMCLIEHIFGYSRQALIINGDDTAQPSKSEHLLQLANRRINGEPLQYLIGQWDFMNCSFAVGKGVLIPREDTQAVVQSCIDYCKNIQKPRILDLCSGSGAIAVVLAKVFPDADITAVELCEEALTYLHKNINKNNVNINAICGNVFNLYHLFPDNSFDLIVSNPPYIISDEIKTLQKEVQFEPKMALDGGKDGYDFYRCITQLWTPKLKQGGALALELGEDQFGTVKQLMLCANLNNIKAYYDLGEIQRAIIGTLR